MRRIAFLAALIALLALGAVPARSQAQSGERIVSFDTVYTIDRSGTISVFEGIKYDFGDTPRHGIFRTMPVRYDYDTSHDRNINVYNVTVIDDQGNAQPFEIPENDPNITIKIGDPDVTVTGVHTYEISYTLDRVLNPFDDHDEFFWNVTGLDWDVPIEEVSAVVAVNVRTPASAPNPITRIRCVQGPEHSTTSCQPTTARIAPTTPSGTTGTPVVIFKANGSLFANQNMTIVVGIDKGIANVAPPNLVDKPKNAWQHAFALNPITVGLTLAGIVAAIVAVVRLWWVQGRDRWLGDMFYLNETPSTPGAESTKPLMAHETIVVEFTPPELDGKTKRRLRPAEIGVLLDERADTLDVSATIVDLAVRKHMTITEEKSGGVFGLFKSKDYELTRLTPDPGDLLSYESQLKDALFDTGDTVKLSDLKNKFHDDLATVKTSLYKQTVADKFFPRNPETVRQVIRIAGVIVGVLGGLMVYGFGKLFGGALIGVPLIVVGVLLLFTASAFPRRTGRGRLLYRRSLGFRRFMVESDAPREKFAENANIFHDYLPYAIVYGCVDRWAKVFKDLGIDTGTPGYYIGTGPFVAAAFADSMTSFSSSISSTMASTPGGSGGSGFGGGSGGGGGGGGGGSW